MKRTTILFALVLGTILVSTGCTQSIPAGHIGRTWEPGGFKGDLLKPGRHDCYGRCQLYLMESTDQTFEIPMNVLCADNLNFKFTVDTLVSVNLDNAEEVKAGFESLKPAGDHLFTVEQLFLTYVKPVADQEARKVVSKYQTNEIVQKRAQVIEEVRAAVMEATKTGILEVKRVTVGNLDFPDVITKAQEARAERQVEVETAKAEGEKQAAQAEARLALARIQASERLLKAQSEADANRILASSVTPQLIMWKQWDVMAAAADGRNNMFLVPYTDAANNGVDTSKWASPQGIVDAELLRRLNDAKAAAQKVNDDAASAKAAAAARKAAAQAPAPVVPVTPDPTPQDK